MHLHRCDQPRPSVRADLLLAVAALMAVAGPAQANTSASVTAQVLNDYVQSGQFYAPASQVDSMASAATSSSAHAEVRSFALPPHLLGRSVAANGDAFAAHGVLRVGGNVAADTFGSGRSFLEASFGDTLVINAAGRTGQRGIFSVSMSFHWTDESTFLNSSDVGANVRIKTEFSLTGRSNSVGSSHRTAQDNFYADPQNNRSNRSAKDYSYVKGNQEVPYDTPLVMEMEFRFGTAFSFEAVLRGEVYGHSGTDTVRASLDAMHTALWRGATVSFNGQAVDYTMSSASGVDWSQLVPEPGTWALMLGGLALLGLRARARRA